MINPKLNRIKIVQYIAVLTLASFMPSSVFAGHSMEANMTDESNIANYTMDVTAHRGNSVHAPENTEAAIVRAIQQRADFVEIDVQETADGQVVLLHDDTFLRTAGINKSPIDLTMTEIDTLDVGNWFSKQYAKEAVPKLRDILIKYQDEIKFNIHMKNSFRQKRLTTLVGEIILDTSAYDNCVVTSFEYTPLQQLKKLDQRIKTGLIIYYNNNKLAKYNVDLYSLSAHIVTPELVKTIKKLGREIHVWTVNDKETVNRLLDLQANNIITDNVQLARAELVAKGFHPNQALVSEWIKNSYRH